MISYIKNYVQYRDAQIDHQLFGSFTNHRDLIILNTSSEQQDISQIKNDFRKITQLFINQTELQRNDNYFEQLLIQNNLTESPVFINFDVNYENKEQLQKNLKLKTPMLVLKNLHIDFFNSQQQKSDATAAFPAVDSNSQIKTLFKKQRFLEYYADWLVVRQPLLKSRQKYAIDQFILKNCHLEDEKFLEILYEFIFNRKRPLPLQSPPPNSFRRQQKRVDELMQLVNKSPITSLLDIGCSDGFMAEQFGSALLLKREQTFGMDIRPALSQKIVFIENPAETFLEQCKESFDLVTICMTLHHIAFYKKVLQNAFQYIKKGKYLYIREHDAYSNDIKLLLDIHDQTFNSALWEHPESEHSQFVKFCKSWFLSQKELFDYLEKELGFKLIEARRDERDWEVHGCVYQALFKKQ